MRTIKTALAGAALGLAFFGLAHRAWSAGLVSEAWTAHYNGPSNDADGAYDCAVDAAGNVFVTGYSLQNGVGEEYATAKYDATTGAELWTARLGGDSTDFARSVAVDANGDVVVTGRSGSTCVTVKYNGATGEQLWQSAHGLVGDTAAGWVVALDALGNVFVTGTALVEAPGKTWNYLTLKYDGATGAELWLARYNGPGNGFDSALAMAVAPDGDVVVTGVSYSGGGVHDYATVKYDGATGDQLWVSRYAGEVSGGPNYRLGLAVDAAGNPVIAVRSHGGASDFDYATVKYNGATGAEQWASRYNGPGNGPDYAQSVSVDAAGNVFVTGVSWGGASDFDYVTVKYNGTTGAQQWLTRSNGTNNGYDEAVGIVTVPSGDVVVTGYSSSVGTNYDYVTIAYDGTTGSQEWSAGYNGTGNRADYAEALTADAAGNIVVTGTSQVGTTFHDFDYGTVRYLVTAAATNATGSCLVTRGGLKKSLATGRYAQVVTVKNVSGTSLTGPISLVLDNLIGGVTLFNKTGDTSATSPAGSPYRNSAGTLAPGASASITLEFTNPGNTAITYTPRVLAGAGMR